MPALILPARLRHALPARRFPITVALLCACGAPPVVGRSTDARAPDGLLERAELQALVERQRARDPAALIAALDRDDAQVRARAAFALGSVQDRSAAPALIEALRDPEPAVRADAAFALGQLAPAPAGVEAALLRALAGERDEAVGRMVVEALGKSGGAEAASVLIDRVAGPSPDAPATLALARLVVRGVAPEKGSETLAARLEDADSSVREAAAWGLGSSPSPRTRRAARAVMGRALDGYAADDHAAAYLLRALGSTGDPGEVPRIAAWSERATDWRIRVAAAEALAASGAAGRAALLPMLDDSSAHVRVAAASALALAAPTETDVEEVLAWIRRHPEDRYTAGALMAAVAAGGREEAVLAWVRGLPTGEEVALRRGIEALALVPGPEAVRALAEIGGSGSPSGAGAALRALALRWENDRETAALRPFYLDAFRSALRTGDPVTAPVAAALLSDPLFAPLGADSLLRTADPLPPPPRVELPALDWRFLRELGRLPELVLETDRGTIVLQLVTEQAPLTAQTLGRLARTGRLDGVPFHRVVPDFVIQGGDVERGDGSGEPGFRLVSELTRLPFRRGAAGMASTGKDTENSQYFIMQAMQPLLDGGYTAFGSVVEGQEVVDRILEGERVVRASIRPDDSGP